MSAGPSDPEEAAELAATQERLRAQVVDDETPQARRHRRGQALATLLGILALVAINWLWFHLIGSDYLKWFIENGTLIALAFALVSVAVDLNGHSGLIAASPTGFVGALLQVFIELTESLISVFSKPRSDVELWDEGHALMTSRYRSPGWDMLFGGLFIVLFFALMAGWIFVVAPLQYFLNLPCGAPARMALASGRTIWVDTVAGGTWHTVGTKEQVAEAIDRGASEMSFATKPVTLTSGLSALVLYGVAQFV